MRLMEKIFLSCKEVTELTEKKQLAKLTFKEKFQFNMHLMMCKACKSYQQQSLIMEKMIQKWFKPHKGHITKAHLPESVKADIIRKVKNN